MKKNTSLILLLLCVINLHAEIIASGKLNEKISWTISDDGILTISGTGEMPDYEWGDSPFYNNTYIKKVIINFGVTSIGEGAFYDCSGLTSVDIPNSVTSIGQDAFAYCSGLTSVDIPNSVWGIGWAAFSGCSGLTSISIPNSVTSIGGYAFSGCSSLTSVSIPNSVTSIDDGAFEGCSGLTSVDIPNSVTSIGRSAFFSCSGLTSVNIPNSVTSVGYKAFSDCSGLTSIVVESGNPIYDSRDNCNAIIETASNSLIQGCKNTIIPNSVTSIGYGAFSSCSGLTSVTIPNSVTSIGGYAFSNCSGLTSVDIPNSVTSIGASAFSNCSGLTSVDIPNSVTSIGGYAFSNCSGLTSITIPNSVTSISRYAFYWCSDLTSVTIPNSVTSIGASAFCGCIDLTSITIPNSVTSIGEAAFDYCHLRTIIAKQSNPEWYENAFSDATYTHAMLYVPEGTFWDYVYVSKWGTFINIKEMANSAQEVRENQFYMLADAKGCNFAVYDAEASALKNVEYSFGLEEDKLGTYWKVEKSGNKARLYNQAAGKYAAVSATGEVSLSDTPVDLDITTENDAIKINGCEKMLVLNQNDEITAIGAVEINNTDTDAPIYDLTGRKVQNAAKGVYIKNGKKMLVK